MLERLARRTAFSAGRERALALRPVSDRESVVRRQRETAEAVLLDANGVNVPLDGAHDVRERVRGAARGRTLTPSELLEIAYTAACVKRVRAALTRGTPETPLLSNVAAGMADLDALRELIEQSIDDRGEVTDDASPELRKIRRELGIAHARLHQRMQSLLHSTQIAGALQEAIVTIRDGRYVVPVRSEARSAVPGVLHDTSASGATVFIEPIAIVELGNAWRELQAQERHEVERILRELSDATGEAADDIVDAVERLAGVDLALAKARLAEALDARALAVVGAQPWLVEPEAGLRLNDARHPLLEGEVVPVTIVVGGDYQALLITGPNTGGKTVALKTAGLLCAMALAGLPVPAEAGSQVPVYEGIFADIGDEQSIEQSLSTFSGHITAIIDVIERADGRSLVLLDELGAGTDPTEGAALAIAIVDRLVAARATLIATTHHSALKLYAHRTEGVMNASVEFDMATLAPTYRLSIGLPGQSNALAIATRLGMPADVVESAREGLTSEERDLEALLGELRERHAAAEQDAARAAAEREQAGALRADLQRQAADLSAEHEAMREDARREVRRELRRVERLLQRTRREVEAARLEQADADLVRAREAAEDVIASDEPPVAVAAAGEADERVVIERGRAVWLRGLASPGEVLSEPDERGEFDVQLGALRTRVRAEQVLRTASSASAPAPAEPPAVTPPPPVDVSSEVEVRGRTVDEALPVIERYLDQAARGGLERVRVIHGRGTGTLRGAVRELLSRHPLVTRYETAEAREGGDGVTIAYLARA